MARRKSEPKHKKPVSLGLTSRSNLSDRSTRSQNSETSYSSNSSRSRRKSTPQKKNVETSTIVKRRQICIGRFGKREVMNYKTFREIKYLQTTVHNVIPKLPFSRLIREILMEAAAGTEVSRVQALTLQALQEASERFLTQLFEDANEAAFHAKRVTVFPRDIALVLSLRKQL